MAKPRSKFKKVKWLFGKEIEIPTEWTIRKLNELGNIITGNTPSTSIPGYYSNDYLWASPKDLGNTKFIENTASKLSTIGFKISRAIPENSILVVCIGSTIGKIGIAPKTMSSNQQINSIMCNSTHPEFIYYLLLQNNKMIKNLANQAAVPILNKTDFGTIRIILPCNYDEQVRIASILSGVDALIESTQEVIAKTERLKKGLMQKLLTRGIGHMEFKKVKWLFGKEIEIPVGWEISKFHSKIHMKYGSSLTEKQRDNHGKPVYGSGGVIGFHSKPIVQGPALLVARKGSLGNTFYETNYFFPIDTVYYITKNETEFNLQFLFYYIKNMKLENYAIITSKPGISRSEVYSLTVLFPSLLEQTKIASILSGVDAYIQKNHEYKKKMELLKKGLMQKLLTGQIRVQVDH